MSLRLLCFAVSALMVLCVFAACAKGSEGNEGETTNVAGGDVTTVDETKDPTVDKNGYILDTIPDSLDYGGKIVTILTWADVEHEEFVATEQTGEAVNDAIYLRNFAVEDRLGIDLQFISTNGDADEINNWVNYVQTAIQSGANSFDIMAGYSLSMAATANAGYCYNLLDSECEYLNFNMPWWPDRLISEATINNKLFFASGDISANALYMMYVCYVNNDIVTDMNLPNVFELVDNNQWTYAKFIEMCTGVYNDLNGNGIKDVGDRYGYMTSGIHTDPWFYGSGALFVDKDANGNLQMSPSFSGERVIKSLEMVNNLLYNTNDGLYTSSVQHQKEFNNGNLLFISDRARVSFKVLISDTLHFSIVPFPKYDENQEKFVTVMGNPFTLYALPIDSKSDELPMLSAVIETYASESFRKLTPAVFEVTLKTKYVQDAESARMYDIIRENLTFDLGRIFSNVLINQGAPRTAISTNAAGAWANTVKASTKIMATKLAALSKVFEG